MMEILLKDLSWYYVVFVVILTIFFFVATWLLMVNLLASLDHQEKMNYKKRIYNLIMWYVVFVVILPLVLFNFISWTKTYRDQVESKIEEKWFIRGDFWLNWFEDLKIERLDGWWVNFSSDWWNLWETNVGWNSVSVEKTYSKYSYVYQPSPSWYMYLPKYTNDETTYTNAKKILQSSNSSFDDFTIVEIKDFIKELEQGGSLKFVDSTLYDKNVDKWNNMNKIITEYDVSKKLNLTYEIDNDTWELKKVICLNFYDVLNLIIDKNNIKSEYLKNIDWDLTYSIIINKIYDELNLIWVYFTH